MCNKFLFCKKAPPTFDQKSELRVTLKKGTYLLIWYISVGNQLLAVQFFFTEAQLFTETKIHSKLIKLHTIGSTLGPWALDVGSYNYFEPIEILMAI